MPSLAEHIVFPSHCWLASSKGDGKIVRDFISRPCEYTLPLPYLRLFLFCFGFASLFEIISRHFVILIDAELLVHFFPAFSASCPNCIALWLVPFSSSTCSDWLVSSRLFFWKFLQLRSAVLCCCPSRFLPLGDQNRRWEKFGHRCKCLGSSLRR